MIKFGPGQFIPLPPSLANALKSKLDRVNRERKCDAWFGEVIYLTVCNLFLVFRNEFGRLMLVV